MNFFDTLLSFNIYSVGDSYLLFQMAKAIAFVWADANNGLIRGAAILGGLLGLILIVFQTITTQQFKLQYLLAAIILYAAFFLPRAEVVIVDSYGEAPQVQAGVPLGIAVAASIISSVGYTFANRLGDEYVTPTGNVSNMTNNGFMDSLNVIVAMRKTGAGTANSDTALVLPGNVEQTVKQYMKDCVLHAIDMSDNEITLPELRNADSVLDAMESTKTGWLTVTFLPGEPTVGVAKNCSAAYTDIKAYIEGDFFTAWNDDYLAKLLNKADPHAFLDGTALPLLGGVGLDAQDYMLNTFLKTLFEEGDAEYQADLNKVGAVITKISAIEQRNIQWATDQSMFKNVARPIMAFVEAFVFGIAPIMVFLVMIGPYGWGLIGKYMLLMLWVQTWPITMTIVDFYINVAASDRLSALSDVVANATSLGQLDNFYKISEQWVATGGMLASAVPAISLMLIYGSAVTATHLAGRMQSQDHVNEKIMAPDAISPSAALEVKSLGNHSLHGTNLTGSENFEEKFNANQLGMRASSSAKSNFEQASQALSEGSNNVFSKSFATSMDKSLSNFSRESIQSSNSQMTDAAWNASHLLDANNQLSFNEKKALSAQMSVGGGFSGGVGGETPIFKMHAGGKVSLDTMLQSAGVDSQEKRNAITEGFNQNSQLRDSINSSLQSAQQMDASSGVTSRFTEAANNNYSKSYSDALTQQKSASENLQQTEQAVDTWGTTTQFVPSDYMGTAMRRGESGAMMLAELREAMVAENNSAGIPLNNIAQEKSYELQQKGIAIGNANQDVIRQGAGIMHALAEHAPDTLVQILSNNGFSDLRGSSDAASEITEQRPNISSPKSIAPEKWSDDVEDIASVGQGAPLSAPTSTVINELNDVEVSSQITPEQRSAAVQSYSENSDKVLGQNSQNNASLHQEQSIRKEQLQADINSNTNLDTSANSVSDLAVDGAKYVSEKLDGIIPEETKARIDQSINELEKSIPGNNKGIDAIKKDED